MEKVGYFLLGIGVSVAILIITYVVIFLWYLAISVVAVITIATICYGLFLIYSKFKEED